MTGVDPRQGFVRRLHGRSRRNHRPAHHVDGNAELARRLDLGVGRGAARILGEHVANAMPLEEVGIVFHSEWSACGDARRVGKVGGRIDWIYDADQVAMLRSARESIDSLAAKSGEDVLGLSGKCGDCRIDAVVFDPIVAGDAHPRRTLDGKHGHASLCTSGHGVGADARGKRMRGVDDKIDILARDIVRKPFDAAETTDARR